MAHPFCADDGPARSRVTSAGGHFNHLMQFRPGAAGYYVLCLTDIAGPGGVIRRGPLPRMQCQHAAARTRMSCRDRLVSAAFPARLGYLHLRHPARRVRTGLGSCKQRARTVDRQHCKCQNPLGLETSGPAQGAFDAEPMGPFGRGRRGRMRRLNSMLFVTTGTQ